MDILKSNLLYGERLQGDRVDIISLNDELGVVVISAKVFKIESRETKNGKYILKQ